MCFWTFKPLPIGTVVACFIAQQAVDTLGFKFTFAAFLANRCPFFGDRSRGADGASTGKWFGIVSWKTLVFLKVARAVRSGGAV